MKEGKLIVISAPSGSGKSTLVKALLENDLPLAFSISATSRPPRVAEQEGIDYHFLSLKLLKKKLRKKPLSNMRRYIPINFMVPCALNWKTNGLPDNILFLISMWWED